MTTESSARKRPESLERFASVIDPAADPHINGDYFRKHPTWHVEYSPWKAENIARFLARKRLEPRTIAEVGCGAGEVLRQLQMRMDDRCTFWGCDVAPHAIKIARRKENERLTFALGDLGMMATSPFDLMLILEVVDHVEDYMGFLRMLKKKSDLKLFSFSLDVSVQSVLRTGAFTQRREVHSHLHHFSAETAMGALKFTGYDVIDYVYTPSLAFSALARLAKPIRMPLFALSPELTVRLFGGYSLLVLAR